MKRTVSTLIGFCLGFLLSNVTIAIQQEPEPDERLMSRAAGALCASWEFSDENFDDACPEFCELAFSIGSRTKLCKEEYYSSTSRLYAQKSGREMIDD